MRNRPLALLAALSLLIAGCQSSSDGESMTRTEVYFGLSRPADVSTAEFARFVEHEIAPRFPAGFTIIPAEGHWREADGKVVAEPSRLLIVFADSTPEAAALEAIAEAYRSQFGQEAVLKVTSPARVEFETGK